MMTHGKTAYVVALGHEDQPDVIKLDYDLRMMLGLQPDQTIRIEVKKCGWFGTFRWYLSARDPQVRVSAWLAIISVALGLFGIILAFA